MQLLIDFFPVVAFLVAYKFFGGIYVATVVLMIGMPISLAIVWLRGRKFPAMLGINTALVLVAGSATLLLRDARFIQWKPTIFMWLGALAFLVSGFVGKKPLVQRMMQPVVGDAEMSRREWMTLNWAWVLYGIIAGAANLYVARTFSEGTWVNFKLFGVMGMMLVFIIGQMLWLNARGKLKK